MFRYAVNLNKDINICDCESKWRQDLGWTEEMYIGEMYRCQLVNCPYEDAIICDFYEDAMGKYLFNEVFYKERIAQEQYMKAYREQEELLASLEKKAKLRSLSDSEALSVKLLHDEWKPDTNYVTGDRVLKNNELYRCKLDHISCATYSNELMPDLWDIVVPTTI